MGLQYNWKVMKLDNLHDEWLSTFGTLSTFWYQILLYFYLSQFWSPDCLLTCNKSMLYFFHHWLLAVASPTEEVRPYSKPKAINIHSFLSINKETIAISEQDKTRWHSPAHAPKRWESKKRKEEERESIRPTTPLSSRSSTFDYEQTWVFQKPFLEVT